MNQTMKTFLCLFISLLPLLAKAQKIADGVYNRDQLRIFNFYRLDRELQERFAKDTLMSKEIQDSLIVLWNKFGKELTDRHELRHYLSQVSSTMEARAMQIFLSLEKDTTLSLTQKDSLRRVAMDLGGKSFELIYYNRFFIPQNNRIDKLDQLMQENKAAITAATTELIAIASDVDIYPSDRTEALNKLAISKHPVALDYLVANITTVFSRNSDPGMYGWRSFYVYEPDYPYYQALLEHANGTSLFFYLEKYWRTYLMQEHEANLYAHLLSACMKPCGEKCAIEFLNHLRDQYCCFNDKDKKLRENVIRVLAYYANPSRY